MLKSPSGSEREYKLNVCGPVTSELWAVHKDEDKVGAFFRGGHSDLAMGTINSKLDVVHDTPTIFLVDGAACPASEKTRMSTAIRFVCDASAGTGAPISLLHVEPMC